MNKECYFIAISELGYKTCTENGTWYLSPDSGHEWTDYTQCSNIQEYKELHHAIVASNSITVLLALPACIIFLYFRQLRQQQRIRLHVSLLVSAVLVSMCKLIWELTLTRDRLDTQREDKGEDSLLERNPVGN
ncbi:calcitonin gene-related peptide type 1 receptor-like [Aplysia californica]|uniref:Calcitonin gene-related peptide type 1 receptor-like n=1 Tax=Aplysia californica TaxID=6500 RepID=A0ABM0KAY6_APLCA|nr:calcitonin gene-related peptide type 1 receptor-like [Aplysia californica]